MNCELCGKEISDRKEVIVEGSELQVCSECARYGEEVISSEDEKASKNELMKRIEKQRRKRESRKAYGTEENELALDYPERIKEGRIENDLTQEDLAKRINEKRSVITKLEKGDMRPSDDLREKLENALDINLLEELEEIHTDSSESQSALTIGDLIEEK